MERGNLGIRANQYVIFVFDGLVATLKNRRLEQGMLALGYTQRALDLWVFDVAVCEYMAQLIQRGTPVHVYTWHSMYFADLLKDKLWDMDVPVEEVRASEYRFASHRLAVDPNVLYVYDPDPAHRFGYGFRARSFRDERKK